RKFWPGEPAAPRVPTFVPDAVTTEVIELVASTFAHHPGRLDPASLPATAADATRWWQWAKEACLPLFGPYEDAMSRHETTLFHSRTSPLVNLHRLTPRRVLDDVLALDLPLASLEGFVRQLLGWREFMRHVSEHTDGFRFLPSPTGEAESIPTLDAPGDGGYRSWSGRSWSETVATNTGASTDEPGEGGATPSVLGAHNPLPPAWWGKPSGLACLDHVVDTVWHEGWSHHITRLMVLANISTLLDVSPRELTDWFWVAYVDAYDWVVEPNVLAMGTFGTGPLMTTKPYVSGANYINKMSDYCSDCVFDPKKTCPLADLYWAFLERHREQLADNPRLRLPLASAAKRKPARKDLDRAVFAWVRDTLAAGEALVPAERPKIE
ncbi:MAG: cryptochrome/photolyase family protein, partial [Acidobacteriota bacterium]